MATILFIISVAVLILGMANQSILTVGTLKRHPFTWWMLFTVATLGFGILALPVAFRLRKVKKAEDLAALRSRLITEANVFIDAVKTAKALPVVSAQGSLLLDKDERCVLTELVALRETRAVRRSSGGTGSVRVGRYRVGSYSGTSSSSQEWTTLDRGALFLTNKKLIFAGSKENRAIVLKHIVAITTFLDAISITLDNRSKAIQFPVKNPYIWSTSINIAKSVPDPFLLGDVAMNIQLK